MAGPVAHTLGAYATLVFASPEVVNDSKTNRIAWGTAFVFGNLADADFVVAHFTNYPALQHHYFSHSIPFAVLFTLLCIAVLKVLRHPREVKNGLLLGLLYGTHLLIDYFTDDGSFPYGIPLLWPFSNHHFFSPAIIFYATHRGGWHQLLSWHNVFGILIEIAVLLPIVGLARFRADRLKPRRSQRNTRD